MPPSAVTTVVNLRFGSGTGEIGRLFRLQHRENNIHMLNMSAPCAVDEAGRVFIADSREKLYVIDSDAKSVQRIAMPWAKTVVKLGCGTGQTLWLAHRSHCLVKATSTGKPLWEIGVWQIGTRKLGNLKPSYTKYVKSKVVPGKETITSSPYPPNYDRRQAQSIEIEGLFTAANGDVLILDHAMVMRRFTSEGKLSATYDVGAQSQWTDSDLDLKTGFPTNWMISAIATRNGSVYSQAYKAKRRYSVLLYGWQQSGRRTAREVDLVGLEYTGGPEILLMGSDAKGSLYFQYRYAGQGSEKWNGPMAIAKVGKDNVARKIFDIHEHYKGNWTGRIGDIVHVSAKGDVYLEMESATHYRIDKITFVPR